MRLESLSFADCRPIALPLASGPDGVWRTDWSPLLPMLDDASMTPELRSSIFHESLAAALLDQVRTLAQAETFTAVGLTGGVFQNRRLAERVMALLAAEGLPVCLAERVPANPGGLAFGQLVETLGRTPCAPLSGGDP